MLDHLTTLICAGHDTTAFFCSYMCYLLANHQDEQDTLREEINRVMGDRTVVTENDVTDMKYLSKVMQETLRLYSIVPCLTRYSTEEIHIKECGITIPKNVTVLFPMFLINRDPELWENPSQFNPERFDSKAEAFTSAKNGFFPFGYGTRTCIGNTLSILESGVIITQLLRKYKVKPSPGFKLQILAGISMVTSNGVKVVLSPV
jgi:cytochrome P450